MKRRQNGAAIVEFAIAAVLFFTVLLGIFDFGRILFTWNSVAEATRRGARQAVVCNRGSTSVLTSMQKIVPSLTASTVTVNWYDASGAISASCDSSNCAGVAVSVSGVSVTPTSPVTWIGFSNLVVPGFSTYLPREIMGQDPGSSSIC